MPNCIACRISLSSAAHPARIELFERARQLGYSALAITDECSLAGIVRALEASKATGVKLIVGTEVQLADGPKLVLLAKDQDGYSDICRLITTGRRCSAKGEYRLTRADAERLGGGVLVLWIPAISAARRRNRRTNTRSGSRVISADRAWLAVELHRGADDAARLAGLRALGAAHGLPLVAAGDVHMHLRKRRALHDVMTAIRLGCTVAEAGHALFPNGERHLRRIEDWPCSIPRTCSAKPCASRRRCTFDLRKLNYQYPHEIVPDGWKSSDYLRDLTYRGARGKWPDGIPLEGAPAARKGTRADRREATTNRSS